jgi:anti-sigma factor RsiW
MNCNQTIEILPWLLNGSLEKDERQEASDHLKTCEACREALAETRLAWRIFDQHIPAAALVAHAAGDTAEGIDPETLAAHLAACPECSAELELVRMSRGLSEDDGVALLTSPARRQAPVRWRAAAMAAGLTGLVALGGWYHSAEQARTLAARLATATPPPAPPTEQPAPAPAPQASAGDAGRVAELQGQVESMKKMVDDLQKAEVQAREQLAQISGARTASGMEPQVNTWVGDLRSSGDVVRGGGGTAAETEVPAGATATLLLAAGADAGGEREIEITDAGGRVVWQGKGLRLNRESPDYSLTLPRGFLAAGAYAIRLYRAEGGQRTPAESYALRVR